MKTNLFAWAPRNAPDTSVSSTAGLPPAASESAGATVSAAVAPSAPVVEAAPAAPAVEAPVVSTPAPEPAPAATHDFKPTLLETESTPEPAATEAKVETPADPAKPEEAAKAEEKPAEPVAPEPAPLEPLTYDFRFPEKIDRSLVDNTALEKYTSVLNKARVPAEIGQEALDLHFEQVRSVEKRLADTQWEVFNRQQEAWQEKVKADPELGGSRLKTVMRTAASFIEKFGGSAAQQKTIMDVMRTTGAGNNPEVVRMMYRAGLLLAAEPSARNMPPARQVPLTREQKQAARYSK